MRTWKPLLAAASLLLFIGAGCQRTDVGAKIDATVDGILDDQKDEQDAQKDEELDAEEIGADEQELNVNLDATYEIK